MSSSFEKMCIFREDRTECIISSECKKIPERAFENCSSLVNVQIPNSVTSIEDEAFRGCKSLENVEIPDSVTSIGRCVFYGCTSLVSVQIPNSVTYIGSYAFYKCRSLVNVQVPNSVTYIDRYAFKYCTSLIKVEIPNSDTHIDNRAFEDSPTVIIKGIMCKFNEKMTECIISSECKKIPERAFENCSSLVNVQIPNSVTSIGERAFKGCTSLKEIHIPESVKIIYAHAFSECIALTSVYFHRADTDIKGSDLVWSYFWDDYVDENFGIFGKCKHIILFVPHGSEEHYNNDLRIDWEALHLYKDTHIIVEGYDFKNSGQK